MNSTKSCSVIPIFLQPDAVDVSNNSSWTDGYISRLPLTTCFSISRTLFFKRSLSCVCSPRKLIILSFSRIIFPLNALAIGFVGFLLCKPYIKTDLNPPLLDLNIVSSLLVHVSRLCEIMNF